MLVTMATSTRSVPPIMTGTKVCIHCKIDKPVTDFYPHKRMRDGRLSVCAPCKVIQADTWRRNNVERFNETRYRRDVLQKYGVTPEQYDAMVEASDGRCPGCGREVRLVVDHDHSTGKVRELICRDCNLALGHADDDPVRLRALADYLERHA